MRTLGIGTAILLTLLGGWVWYSYPGNSDVVLPELQVLNDRTIVDYAYNPDGTVAYSYLAAKVPDVLVEDEVVELRNETSYTKFIEVVTPGDDPVVKLETRVYSQPAYAQDAGGTWKYLEYATTTEQAFRHRDMTLAKYLTEFLVRSAYADTYSPFSGAGDGYVLHTGAVSWNTLHDDTVGTSDIDTDTNLRLYIRNQFDSIHTIYRGFMPFDTSSVPSSATISGVSFSAYLTSKAVANNDGLDYATVVQTSQVTHTALEVGDYDQCGSVSSPTEGIDSGERKDLSSASTAAYMTFTLNSTGQGWIKKNGQSSSCSATTGITCLGLREGHDTANSAPSNSTGNSVYFSTSEETGTSQDPYLTITYTAPAPAKIRIKMTGGRFNVNGGRFKLQSN